LLLVPATYSGFLMHICSRMILMPNAGFTCKGGLARGVRKQAA